MKKYEDALKCIGDSCLWQLKDDPAVECFMPQLREALNELTRLSGFFQTEKLLPFEGDKLALLLLGSYDTVNHKNEVTGFLKLLPGGISLDFLTFCKTNYIRQISWDAKREDGQLRILLIPPTEMISKKIIHETNDFMEQCGVPVRLETDEDGKICINGENPILIDPPTARQILGGDIPLYLRRLASLGLFHSMNFNIRFGYLNNLLSHISDILWLPQSCYEKFSELNSTELGGKKLLTFLFGETSESFLPFLNNLLEHYQSLFQFKNTETFAALLERWLVVESQVAIRKSETTDNVAIVFPEDEAEFKNYAGQRFIADINDNEKLVGKIALKKECDEIILLILEEMREITKDINTDIAINLGTPITSHIRNIIFKTSQPNVTVSEIKMVPFILALKRDFEKSLQDAASVII